MLQPDSAPPRCDLALPQVPAWAALLLLAVAMVADEPDQPPSEAARVHRVRLNPKP